MEATTTVNPLSGTPRAPICAVQVVAAPTPGEAASATGLTISTNAGPGNLAIAWTPGAGSSGSLVVVRAAQPVTAQPVDGLVYSANPIFGQGSNLGDDDANDPASPNYVVYSGAGSSVTVSNLNSDQISYVAVYSFVGAGASIDYALATPAVGSSAVFNPVTNITVVAPSVPVIVGSARKVTALATLANGNVIDVTALADYTSSAPAVVNFPTNNPGHLAALTTGSASFWATYQGFQATQSVTVTTMSMTHRYDFNGGTAGDTTFNDTVGSANGVVFSEPAGFSGLDGAGNLVLSGSISNYAALPSDLVTNYGAITLEMWFRDNSVLQQNWARLLDVGNADSTHYLFISPTGNGGGTLRAAITTGGPGSEAQLSATGPTLNQDHHVVWTLEPAHNISRLFLDGVQVAINTNAVLSPEDVGSANNWLGRSQFAADLWFNGQYNEFRIYNGALAPLQVALDNATGPEVITDDPGTATALTLSTSSAMNVLDTFQATVTITFTGLGSPINGTALPEVTYSSSNPNVVTVNATGLITAVGPGSATVQASGFGQTGSATVTVTELPLTLNHRYSFNGDYTDSIGGANASPSGGTIGFDAENKRVVFSGTGNFNSNPNGDYVALPPDLIRTWNSISIEIWVKENTNLLNFDRIWDFGGQDANGNGNRYIFYASPANSQVNNRAVIRSTSVGEQIINFSRPTTLNEHHVVYTLNAGTREARIYLDGILWARNTGVTLQPRDLGSIPNMWIGRSQFNADPWFQGSVNELRLWRGAVSPQQVALDYAAGPDQFTTELVGFSSLTITNMIAGNVQQASLGFSGGLTLGSGPLVGPMSGVVSNWVSSDSSVADVDENGFVTAVGPGTATISATFNGTTRTSSAFTVSAGGPVLAHRYSFATDVTDSVAGANGINGGSASINGGSVYLDGSENSYISLPGGMFNTDDVTFETWLTYSNNIPANAPVWSFGDPAVTNYFYFAPSDTGNPAATAGSTVFRYNYGNRGNQERFLARHGRALSGGTNKVHYVLVLNKTRKKPSSTSTAF